MKYNIITFSLIFLVTFLFNSCNEEFMNRTPEDEISEKTFFNTEGDLENYNNSIYNYVRASDVMCISHPHWTFNQWFMDTWGDHIAHKRIGYLGRHRRIRSGHYEVQNGPRNHGYKGWHIVREINYGLDNYHKADVPQETINKYAAEARFFRAWFYFNKVRLFGDVPWIGKPLNIDSDKLYAERMPREQAMDSILADINFAVEHLPEDWPSTSNNSGRFNKWHALFIKSRLSLFEGTWRKYHGGSNPNNWLQEAADAAKEIIENSPYGLYTNGDPKNDYHNLFTKLDHSGNPEVMYWLEYKQGVETDGLVQGYWLLNQGVTKDMIDKYLCTNGEPPVTEEEGVNSLYEGDKTIEDVFKNRDPRMRQTILHPEDAEKYDFWPNLPQPQLLGMDGIRKSSTGYFHIKYFRRDLHNMTWGQPTFPAIIMRYAEVLLNYAEAKAELGTVNQNDLDISINRLRDRAGMPHLELSDLPRDPRRNVDDPLIAEIRRERAVELLGEGLHYFDLLRWKLGSELREPDMGLRWDDDAKARYEGAEVEGSVIEDPITGEMKEYIDVYKGQEAANPIFNEDQHYHWPIPLNNISQNDNLKQNPGWGE